MDNPFNTSRKKAVLLTVGILISLAVSLKFLLDTAELRYERDVNRMVFNDNLGVLQDIRAQLGLDSARLEEMLAATAPDTLAPYLVVSIAERHLWYKVGDSVLFEAPVATASGKTLVNTASGKTYRFDTPRGRLPVTEKEESPAWVPPDWHYIEQARNRGLGFRQLTRGERITSSDGNIYYARGNNIVKELSDGSVSPVNAAVEGRELVVDGNIIIPPFGTEQRRYKGVLGTRRLKMPDGYAIHGTNNPSSIGQAVSHGCIRMLNEDIESLYPMVPVGTMVYIY